MDEIINEKLAKLVCYILETGVWRYQFFWSRCDVVSTFTYKFKIKPRKVISYINNALTKLIGHEYEECQYAIRNRMAINDKFIDTSLKPFYKNKSRVGKKYNTEFNKLFKEHFHLHRKDVLAKHYYMIKEHFNKTGEWLSLEYCEQVNPKDKCTWKK